MRLFVTAFLIAFASAVSAQSFPSKPVRVIVPWNPGSLDVYVRLMAPSMQKDLGQPIIAETKPGATGFIGASYVARAEPDGYTLLITPAGSVVAAYLLAKNPPFDTLRDFAPITEVYTSPQTIVAKPGLAVSDLKELVAFGKANPGKLSHATTGIGSAQHIDAELFRHAAGFVSVSIPYAGSTPAIQSLLAGQTDWGSIPIGNVKEHILSSKLKLLATHGIRAPGDLPKVPALEDLYPDFQSIPGFIGLWAPAGTPQAVIRRLHTAAVKALQDPKVKSFTEDRGSVVIANTPEEFQSTLKSSLERVGRQLKALRAAGVKFE